MKKTFNVNLGGTVFQIDEDAYILLDNYLNNLRFHFRKEEGGEEIVRDMEMRISELFAENLQGGQLVITIDDVERVIKRMGRPEELDDDTNSAGATADTNGTSGEGSSTHATAGSTPNTNGYNGNTGAGSSTGSNGNTGTGSSTGSNGNARTSSSTSSNTNGAVKKRLFRDIDNKILGGVLSGIAAYFGWDPTALRLVYIVLGILPGGPTVLLIYLVLLFIIPAARTATEKLQMRGEPVNMENIGKTVTDGFEHTTNQSADVPRRTGLQRFFDALVSIVGIIVKVFLGFILICCIPFLLIGFFVLFTLVMSALGIFVHIPSVCCELMPIMPWHHLSSSPGFGILFLLSVLLRDRKSVV